MLALVNIFLVLAFLGSAAMWGKIGFRWWRGQPLIPHGRHSLAPSATRNAGSSTPAMDFLLVLGQCLLPFLIWMSVGSLTALFVVPEDPLGKVKATAFAGAFSLLGIGGLHFAAQRLREQPDRLAGMLPSLSEFNRETAAGDLFVPSTFERVREAWRNIVLGLGGLLASVIPVGLVLAATLPWRSQETQHGLITFLQQNPTLSAFFWIALTAVILAPLLEELLFRVILQGTLASVLPRAVSVLISSAAFAAVHGFPDSLALVPLAIILGTLYSFRQSYLAVVVMHAGFNLANLALALMVPPPVPPA